MKSRFIIGKREYVKILVTGSEGFIGRNLVTHLGELPHVELFKFNKNTSITYLRDVLPSINLIFHLAGENRPIDKSGFELNNVGLTDELCKNLVDLDCAASIVFASSVQAEKNNCYGRSKLKAENILLEHQRETGCDLQILRLPNVFGKWSLPNYNSVIATFCHNISRGEEIVVNGRDTKISLLYIDDLIETLLEFLETGSFGKDKYQLQPIYETTLGFVADTIQSFNQEHAVKIISSVGDGLHRALYATFLSFLHPSQFSHTLTVHSDERGVFSEMLRTELSGQFSYFTAKPGVTRGGHYHHTKSEKFLVVNGTACFRFKNIVTGEKYEMVVDSKTPVIVDTVPGWAHDVTNVGDGELVALLWANENFDNMRPDTYNFEL